jgi:hypothetical protein
VRDQAGRMKENIARLDRLREQHAAMHDAGVIGRLVTFISSSDADVAERTWASYAVAFNPGGVMLGIIGFFISYFGLRLAIAPLRSLRTA